jgi:hypothetical protein
MHKTIPNDIIDIYSSYDITNNHILPTSLFEFQERNNEVIIVSHKYDSNDTHPTPLTQWNFLNSIIKPCIGLEQHIDVPQFVIDDQNNVINGNIT